MAVTGSIKHEAGDEILKRGRKHIGAVSPEGLAVYVCTCLTACEQEDTCPAFNQKLLTNVRPAGSELESQSVVKLAEVWNEAR